MVVVVRDVMAVRWGMSSESFVFENVVLRSVIIKLQYARLLHA